MTHDDLVQRAARWLRNSAIIPAFRVGLTRKVQCGVVLTEYTSSISESPDAIGWFDCGRLSILIECKVSRSDFLADRNKYFRDERHAKFGIGAYRYYFTSPGIVKSNLELPPAWGLLETIGRKVFLRNLAEQQERDPIREMALLWSECRKIQIVERGGILRPTKHGVRVQTALNTDGCDARSQRA